MRTEVHRSRSKLGFKLKRKRDGSFFGMERLRRYES